ncbi:hypothetical protein AX16_004173 [Volvariella volvacea WC 439]|nr:hypothetical protein AX16_004173 [Volvariella volvacea WC 439]
MNTSNEPRLPLELERVIFELAARNGSRTKALPPLMLVAHRVRDWLRPILFETVVISSDRTCRPIRYCPPYPTNQEAHHVRRLLINQGYDGPVVQNMPRFQDFISHCHNVQDFAIWCIHPSDLLTQLIIILQSPHRTVAPPGLGLLQTLDDDHTFTWREGNNFSCLPRLRYLAFVGVPSIIGVVRRCLEECKELKALILNGVDEDDLEVDDELRALIGGNRGQNEESVQGTNSEARDLRGYRIVINPDLGMRGMAETWVDGIDQDLLWTRAEEIVQEQLERLVEQRSRIIPTTS